MIPPSVFHRLTCRVIVGASLLFALAVPLKAAPADETGKPAASVAPDAPIPAEFKDPDTGARVVHLSTVPNPASGVIYFTQACITPDSRYALVRYLEPSAGHTAGYMYRRDLTNGELVKLTDRITRNQVLAPKSGNLYYSADDDRAIYATNLLDLKTRRVAELPAGITCANLTVNADETIVAGTGLLASEHANEPVLTTAPNHGPVFGTTFARHDTNLLIAVDIKTGKFTELHRINTWLGHTQFSPVDPALLMYCHEGPWAKVDRIWTLRLEPGAQPQLVLKRAEEGEIAGHEFWSTDGATAWYDHSFGRAASGKRFLEGKNLLAGTVTQYPVGSDIRSIHFTQSPDGRFFVADGHGDKEHPDQQAMFVLVPENGVLRPVKLCSMARNDYVKAEPNPHLTPDQHWVLFTATFFGTPQAYAVEMPRQFWR
jgi:oligogalacturonide lyase